VRIAQYAFTVSGVEEARQEESAARRPKATGQADEQGSEAELAVAQSGAGPDEERQGREVIHSQQWSFIAQAHLHNCVFVICGTLDALFLLSMKTKRDISSTTTTKTPNQEADAFFQWIDRETSKRGLSKQQDYLMMMLTLIANDETLLGRLSEPTRAVVLKAAADFKVLDKRGQ
jgi:hypothetical protein